MNGQGHGTLRVAFPIYLLGGLALGLADGPLGGLAQTLGTKPGMATAACVNVVLPLLAVGLALIHRRMGLAWLGAVGMTAAYTFGLAVAHPQGHRWDVSVLVRSIPPVLVVACLGYAVLGTLAVAVTGGVRGPEVVGPHAPAD